MTIITRPSALPEFASMDVLDPITGLPNVAEPPENKKQDGFQFKETPPANVINWLMRKYYEWIRYQDFLNTNSTPVSTIDSGTTNNVVVTFDPPATDRIDGRIFAIQVSNTNTGASTLAVDSLGARPILTLDLKPLKGGEMVINGVYLFIYNENLDSFILQRVISDLYPISIFADSYGISGCLIRPSVTYDAFYNIDIDKGYFFDRLGTNIWELTDTFTKGLSGPWTPGSGNGGLADYLGHADPFTWYALFALINPNTGAIDFGFDTKLDASFLMASAGVIAGGFTLYKFLYAHVGTADQGKISPFFMTSTSAGRSVWWESPRTDVWENAAFPNIRTIRTAVPIGLSVLGNYEYSILVDIHATEFGRIYSTLQTESPPNPVYNPGVFHINSINTYNNAQDVQVMTNTEAQVNTYNISLTGELHGSTVLSTLGWTY